METRLKRFGFLLVALLALSFASSGAIAVETTAVGEGRTRQEAINNGIRAAVEKALGTMVKSQTQVSQGKLVWDRIASASAGYVKSYDVIAEGKDPISDLYKVKLAVNLDDHKLKNALDEFLNDPRAQRTFQETSFDERKIIVVYKPRTGFDLPFNSKGVQTIMDLIQDKLSGYGFRVFLPDQLVRIKAKSAEMVVDEEDAINLARQEAADAAVVVSFDAAKRPTSDGYNIILCTLSLKAFDTTTGELFANVQDRDKTIARGGEYGIQDGVARTAIKVGPRTVDRLVKKIVDRFSTKRAKFVTLIFRNIAIKDQDRVEGLVEEIGWRYRVSRQTGKYLELEIFSEADPTSVRRTIRKTLKKNGLPLTPSEMIGSRVVFVGTATGGY
ncbi:MAG: hypothetical protein JRJ09_08895 [Deltaproteobacteria bacterium]|nr:hypothetical protein [Deltaproteobacteria bacterium]MBW2048628.1 hypothetical protein [Deltaproteobacteria bacterium]MBW2112780.1 hypothetical protein [Deltaproteobacteria bacterium]MBW2353738.1 hypothetical protein [Deltaproteobacteria bacterium]HDZ89597.1 hypothetical protein [Deltaproteobacteria bacterium]